MEICRSYRMESCKAVQSLICEEMFYPQADDMYNFVSAKLIIYYYIVPNLGTKGTPSKIRVFADPLLPD